MKQEFVFLETDMVERAFARMKENLEVHNVEGGCLPPGAHGGAPLEEINL
jgi:hypothetical protein